MTRPWILPTVALLLALTGCGEGDPAAGQPRTEPIDARTVAAITWRHLDSVELGTAQGHDEVSESGEDEVHLAFWGVLEEDDFVVAVGRPDSEAPTTCAAIEKDSAISSCEVRDVEGTEVLVLSSTQDIMGAGMAGGITWTALRADEESAASASVMVSKTVVDNEPRTADGEDLPIPMDRLVAIVADDDLALRTTQAAVDEGRELDEDKFRD